VSRWEPNARGRLEQAALELFAEQGYDDTTVSQIAQRAGLTERTFFRYYADKREVLFWGQELLQETLLTAVDDAPDDAAPIEIVARALHAVGEQLQPRRDHARRRQAVINANPSLRERELIKLASLSALLAEALRTRGVAEPAASLSAEAGIAVFRVAFESWVSAAEPLSLSATIGESLAELRAVTSAR
jgi:AcrR family transcriptional regulator